MCTDVPDPSKPNPSSAQTTLSLPHCCPRTGMTLLRLSPCFPGSPVVLKLILKEQTERRAFLREYCIALCLSSHAACLRALPIAFETATHFAFGQELAPAGDLCALLNPGVCAAPGALWEGDGGQEGWEDGGGGARTDLQWGAVTLCGERPFAVWCMVTLLVGGPFAVGCK